MTAALLRRVFDGVAFDDGRGLKFRVCLIAVIAWHVEVHDFSRLEVKLSVRVLRWRLCRPLVGVLSRHMNLPTFHNDPAYTEIRIGVREFACMGVLPPHDHPHVYLRFEDGTIMCPYCSTIFRFDSRLAETETDPPGLLYIE